MASGPNSSWLGPSDFQVPLPRLQSIRIATRPSALNAIVYFARSSGELVLSSID
jgi:hypothetical protein